jgi:hypothetical protein
LAATNFDWLASFRPASRADRRSVRLVFVLFVFVHIIIIVVGISR